MDFKLPDIGEGVHEGEITKWLVKAGDKLKADQPMVEVMTDKATVEIPSPVNGTVESLFAKEGERVEVGKVIIKIAENGKTAAAAPTPAPAPAPKAQAAPVPKPQPAPVAPARVEKVVQPAPPPPTANMVDAIPFTVLATPATRKLARDLNVDLRSLKGTGPHGRVTKMDVQMAYEGVAAATPRSSHPAATGTAMAPAAQGAIVPSKPIVPRGALQRIPFRGIRKKISEAMALSKHTAAHFTYVEEVDMTAVVKLRASAKEEAKKKETHLTYLPFVIKALIPALIEFPFLNSSLDEEHEEIVLKGDYNIGIATDTPSGLIVPVVKGADRKTVWELAKEIEILSDKARTGRVSLEDLKGGTFTITNAGSIGGVFATPIINYPEVAILGVNAIRKRPVVKDDQIAIADMMYLSLSVDHRIVDGADAARFMNRLVYFLSDPTRLVFA